MINKKVNVFGLGYIGLPTAIVLANHGYSVCGIEIDQSKIDAVNSGVLPIAEPNLDSLLKICVNNSKLKAVNAPDVADIHIIAVPTPRIAAHTPDLSFIENAAKALSKVIKKGDLVILESTSPVGTTEKLAGWLAEQNKQIDFKSGEVNLAYCPERVLPGSILFELINNDRIVGGLTPECAAKACDFYNTFVKGDCHVTNSRTAEIGKLTENAFRDINIAFANELSIICDKLDIDVWDLIELVNKHPRVNLLNPGPGVGGHCIAVDPWFIVNSAPDESRLVRMARDVNDSKPDFVIKKVQHVAKSFEKPKIACLGLAFKANVDDLRESPSLDIAQKLAKEFSNVLISEPHIDKLPESFDSMSSAKLVSCDKAIKEADIVVLLVDHNEFKSITIDDLDSKVLVDTRGFFR